ncbi:molybdopterin-dependent oxidoreductase [Streptomyces sp. Caat 7-52]|uniref:molybdopterin-dependent oxidoreductase n=1 Tax=Streptomyces sp. Caat 7-52 TaxID=2949637 RepID=UPI002034AD1F|nr:molybdopterin-dependent oxidoreductase [Streptomyces sp. Caat 7-52]
MTLAELTLAGDLVRPARLTVPDLLRWPQHRADVSFECATSGIQHHEFAGPRLYDVLADAGPGFDPARRKDRLRFLIAVTGTDIRAPFAPRAVGRGRDDRSGAAAARPDERAAGSDAVDVHVRGLHARGGLHADLQAQLLHGFPGQQ